MSFVRVAMDDGGAIRDKNSKDSLVTNQFGGCTAVCAFTDSGVYALYHLRSTYEAIKGCNTPYEEWIRDLRKIAAGEKIHFYVGTPSTGMDNDIEILQPQLGMERYLRKLCKQFELKNYSITLLNMRGVVEVVVSGNGLKCIDRQRDEFKPEDAKIQSDEVLLEKIDLTNLQRLSALNSDPNMDYDGALRYKYQLLCKLESVIERYQKAYERMPKGHHGAFYNLAFAKELYQCVKLGDQAKLNEMKSLDYFPVVIKKYANRLSALGELYHTSEAYLQDRAAGVDFSEKLKHQPVFKLR